MGGNAPLWLAVWDKLHHADCCQRVSEKAWRQSSITDELGPGPDRQLQPHPIKLIRRSKPLRLKGRFSLIFKFDFRA